MRGDGNFVAKKELGRSFQGKIDIQIKLEEKFIIFIESKLAMSKLGKNQLKKYCEILKKNKPFLALYDQFLSLNLIEGGSLMESLLE